MNIATKNNTLNLVMRLTDDYLIISESSDFLSNLTGVLKKMSNDNNFKFNDAKFKSNFKLFEGQQDIQEGTIQWIGKTIDLTTMEMEHLQITDKKEAFFTVINIFIIT